MARAIQILPRKTKSLGKFSRMHKRNSRKRKQINFTNLQNGFIVQMDYFGKWTNRFKTSHYLVIEPKYGGYVHVFDIDFVPASALRYLVTLTINRMPGEFVFGNSTYSFLEFKQSGKALYRMLYPIMKKSYRKLIRKATNIRRTYILDYNFSRIRQFENPKFVTPNLKKEKIAFTEIAEELELRKKKLKEVSEKGRLTTLTPVIWSNIVNTRSWDTTLTQSDVIELAQYRGKTETDVKEMIEAMKANHTFEAPIIMRYSTYKTNEYYVIAGEVRLMCAMALRITPKVYIFTYEPDEKERQDSTFESSVPY